MDHNHGQAPIPVCVRLPMAMTEHTAAVGRVDFDRFGRKGHAERGTRNIVPEDGLEMAVEEASPRSKGGEPTLSSRRGGRLHPATLRWLRGIGAHECLGKDASRVALTAMMKVIGGLDNLRRAPGPKGELKTVPRPGGFYVYMREDHSSYFPFPLTMQVNWDGELPPLPEA